ncbi:type IV pilus biogenesis/stability protein PilW [Vibrio cholerae]|uniref:type IV pilus biogenesis/stability protein PilW n=1 Tax=Vibrio cholerae TaxID=666 RepID=UPI0011D7C237|nr:type IV pilus biogenesis/stability protein PilW [Vibrio cholerae]NOE59524.1 type IV pilus biogenesis/stability protein PilW [Vibrio cholerae]TXY39056.1 type IV pilus biogenesis/stability protein PilW [Vibrio cholerae]GIB58620.1 fimbrial biogenesis and twitching motility protein, putative [Vibrio cholerae]GIB73849.1 fimbrial biogenesis and twitching motility protein, putative [Vibrio cholerae]HDZ9163619.1 type IV pilus biogenesis/stability protein PilW [Vibrio cholerae]
MKNVFGLGLIIALAGCVTVTETAGNATQSDPTEMAEARIALGLGYLENGSMIKARENLEKALQHAPDYYRSQLSMAHYYEAVGENDSARKMYRTALSKHPKNGNVLNNFGTFLCKQGEYDTADQYFRRAVEQPYYYLISASYENAGLCALKAGKTDNAREYFKRAIDHDPNRLLSILQLTKMEIEAGDYTPARLRLMDLNQRYGYQKASLKLLIELEKRAGNSALEQKYQTLLNSLS